MPAKNIMAALGSTYRLDDRKAAVQSAINCYIEAIEGQGEQRPLTQVSAPGLAQYQDLGAEIRGQHDAEGRHFLAAGGSLYEIVDGVPLNLGNLFTDTGAVSMSHNNTQMTIVDGPCGYVLDLSTNTLTRITSDGWRGSDCVSYLDGYTIFAQPGTDQFYLTQIDDSQTLDALDFSSADAQPDKIVAHLVSHRELVLLGKYTTEIWVNSGGALFPFQRNNSAPIDVGCVGKRAAIIAGDCVFWIGQTRGGTGIVYRMTGHAPQRVSTRSIEQMLAKSSDLSQARLWTYQVDGHEFIGINAPGLSTTITYDVAMQQWHERAEWIDGDWAPWRTTNVCFVGGAQYAGADDGKLYCIDAGVYTYGDDPIVRERTWPHMISPAMQPVAFRMLELACSTGAGGVVTLEVSNNGGYTFGPKLSRSLGAVGQWMQKVRWSMLGTTHDRVFRIRCSDAVPFNIHAASVDYA